MEQDCNTKSIISLTEAAVERIQYLLAKRARPALGIRVGLKSGGCSGMKYVFEYADDKKPTDEEVFEKGVRVFIDFKAILYITGTQLDYHDEKVRSGFIFRNPNAVAHCGCGESFSI